MLTRYFNSVEINHADGTFIKKSTNTEKLEREVEFYKFGKNIFTGKMPELVGYSSDYSSYTLDYIDGIDLGQTFSLDKCSASQLDSVFLLVSEILSDKQSQLSDASAEYLSNIFIGKAIERAENLTNKKLRDIFFSGVVINNKPYKSLSDLLLDAKPVLASLSGSQIVLHGDMCFSNIVIESKTNDVYFVDPRGGFEVPSIYGPAIYDVAKLAQSVIGLYDLITNNRYSLFKSDNSYSFRIYPPVFQRIAEEKFMESISKFNLDSRDVRTLAGVMLAGAPIFHIDDEDRATAIALRAVELLG